MMSYWTTRSALCIIACAAITHRVGAMPLMAQRTNTRLGEFLGARYEKEIHAREAAKHSSDLGRETSAIAAEGKTCQKVGFQALKGDAKTAVFMMECWGNFDLHDESEGAPVYRQDVSFMNLGFNYTYVYWSASDSQWLCGIDTDEDNAYVKLPAESPTFQKVPPQTPALDVETSAWLDVPAATYQEGDSYVDGGAILTCVDTNWMPPWDTCSAQTAQESKDKCPGASALGPGQGNLKFCDWDKDTKACSPVLCEPDGEEVWISVDGGVQVATCSSLDPGQEFEGHCGTFGQMGPPFSVSGEMYPFAQAYQACPQCGCKPSVCTWTPIDDHGEGSTACPGERDYFDQVFSNIKEPGSGLKDLDECKKTCSPISDFVIWIPSPTDPTCVCQQRCDNPTKIENRMAFKKTCYAKGSEPKEGEDDDADDDDTDDAGNATKAEPTPVVAVVNIHNLDYDILANDPSLHAKVEAAIREAIASEAGDDIQSDEVALVSWPGSVRARAVLKPADDVESASIVSELKKSAKKLDRLITKKVKKIHGIKTAIKGDLRTDFDVLVAEKVSSVSHVLSKPKGQSHLNRVYDLERKAAVARRTLGSIEAEEKTEQKQMEAEEKRMEEIQARRAAAEQNATTAEQALQMARDNVTEAWYGPPRKEVEKSRATLPRCEAVVFFLLGSLVGWSVM